MKSIARTTAKNIIKLKIKEIAKKTNKKINNTENE